MSCPRSTSFRSLLESQSWDVAGPELSPSPGKKSVPLLGANRQWAAVAPPTFPQDSASLPVVEVEGEICRSGSTSPWDHLEGSPLDLLHLLGAGLRTSRNSPLLETGDLLKCCAGDLYGFSPNTKPGDRGRAAESGFCVLCSRSRRPAPVQLSNRLCPCAPESKTVPPGMGWGL